jgi:hypothetical protein
VLQTQADSSAMIDGSAEESANAKRAPNPPPDFADGAHQAPIPIGESAISPCDLVLWRLDHDRCTVAGQTTISRA